MKGISIESTILILMDDRLNEIDQHWKTDSMESKQTEAVNSDRALRHNSEIEKIFRTL